jgi:hypothetical protein
MDAALWRKIILCTCATFLGFIGVTVTGFIWFGFPLSLHTLGLATATVVGLAILFQFWRPLLWFTAIVGFMLLLALLIDGIDDAFWPDAPDMDSTTSNTGSSTFNPLDVIDLSKEKSRRRLRIDDAIAKRKARLKKLLHAI